VTRAFAHSSAVCVHSYRAPGGGDFNQAADGLKNNLVWNELVGAGGLAEDRDCCEGRQDVEVAAREVDLDVPIGTEVVHSQSELDEHHLARGDDR
jgi:hypothetical protein